MTKVQQKYDQNATKMHKDRCMEKTHKKIHQWWIYVCMCSRKMWNDGFLFRFFSTVVFIDNFPPLLWKKNKTWWIFMYVCMCKAKSIIDGFFWLSFLHLSLKNTIWDGGSTAQIIGFLGLTDWTIEMCLGLNCV